MLRKTKNQKKKGFTLIELIIVIAIIAILAALVVPSLIGTKGKAQVSVNRASVKTITDALETYYADNDKYPASADATTLFTTGDLKDTFDGEAPTYKDGTTKIVFEYKQTASGQDYELYFNDDTGTKNFDESLVMKGSTAVTKDSKTVMNPGTAASGETAASKGYITSKYVYDKLFK